MEKEKSPTYRVLVSGSEALTEEVLKLGFKEEESIGFGMDKLRVFKKGDKFIYSGYYYVRLSQLDPKTRKKIISYNGSTIHDEKLKFFANRNPIEIKNK